MATENDGNWCCYMCSRDSGVSMNESIPLGWEVVGYNRGFDALGMMEEEMVLVCDTCVKISD